jgi:hypothetical protein
MGVVREEFKGAKERSQEPESRSQEALGLARVLPGGEPLLNFARNLS